MSILNLTAGRMAIALSLSAVLLPGCSSSSPESSSNSGSDQPGSGSTSSLPGTEMPIADGTDAAAVPGSGAVPANLAPNPAAPDPATPAPVSPDPAAPAPVSPDPATSSPVLPGPVVPDPLIQNFTRVDFDITVPAFQSNALQVRLLWANKVLTARWAGDEFWTVSDDFPTNTEHPLVVEFNDRNGDITLGRVETVFKTGTNASESFQVTAEQFDTNQDDDGDGSSNLIELAAGTDPLVNETELLEVREPFQRPVALGFIAANSDGYETRIPAERPYYELTEEIPVDDYLTDRTTRTVAIDIDASGSGSFSEDYLYREQRDLDRTTRNESGTRTQTENSVTWTGSYYRLNNSAYRGEDIKFTIETRKLDEQTWIQRGELDSQPIGGYDQPVKVSYTLTGSTIVNSSNCLPTSGSVEYEEFDRIVDNRSLKSRSRITKDPDDQYWVIRRTTLEDELIEEYLVRAIDITFYCDFKL